MSDQAEEKPIEKVKNVASQAAQAESAPPHVRSRRTLVFQIVLGCFAGGFAVLTFLVKAMPSFEIDLQIERSIQMINFPIFKLFMVLISWPGYGPQSFIITLLVSLLIYGFGLHWESLMSLAAAFISTGINLLVKDLVQRPRPTPNQVTVLDILKSPSFPSGHVMFYIGFFGFIGFLAFTLLKHSIKRSIIMGIFAGLIVLIGASRIYEGEHWPSDVLGAYLLGSLTLVGIIQIYLWGKKRFFVNQPVAPEPPKLSEN
jgi:membrane-associated phospholipid phosphatase